MHPRIESTLFAARVPARWQWRIYQAWHFATHVALRRPHYFCHYCAEREEGR